MHYGHGSRNTEFMISASESATCDRSQNIEMGFSRSPAAITVCNCAAAARPEKIYCLCWYARALLVGPATHNLPIVFLLLADLWAGNCDARTYYVARPIINTVAYTVGDFIHYVKVSAVRASVSDHRGSIDARSPLGAIVFIRGPIQMWPFSCAGSREPQTNCANHGPNVASD